MKVNKTTAAFVLTVSAIFLFVGFSSRAGVVDDWLSQKTETAPGYFEGQKRGYYTAGSFSARWPQGNDYLMTVTPPKVKAGCGGIDALMGGFSFLNVDYLVQKLQRMIQAAPAVAFDIALKVLTQEMSGTVKDFENIINKLNNIQLDECKGAKALVATIAPPGFDDKQGTMAKAVSEFKSSSGIDDLWQSTQKAFRANGDKAPSKEAGDPNAGNTSGCPADVKAIFGDTGSVVDKLSTKFGSAPYADAIRGFMGDIWVQKYDDGTFQVSYKSPCEKNGKGKEALENFVNGELYAMGQNWACYKTTDSNLVNWVSGKMQKIASKYKAKGQPDNEDQLFLNSNPLPVGLVLKYAVGTNQEGAVLGTLADVTAKAYAYSIATEFYNKVIAVLEKAKQVATSNKSATSGAGAHQCQVELFEDSTFMVADMETRAYEMAKGLRDSYAAILSEVSVVMSTADKLQRFDEMAHKLLSAKFGSGVANRAMGK
ncbi:MAG: conjugal transfer protein TraH [Nitrospirae bacterium]|nr:conjugal transfer protein TraH [Nitrospirota bacterium]MCL5237062.1 conjugal transfer protein TraH [Nitrospirota bacterium]